MCHKQIEGKIKYRFACLLLNKLLEDKFITKDELISFKKKLIKKYKPIISVLEEIDKKIIKEITPIKKKIENAPTKKRVTAYARVSTEQDEQLHSLQVQRDYYDNYIKSNPNWELVNIYYDEGITGTSLKRRKGFNQMIADALDGKIDVILVKSVSRFARNTIDALQTTRDLKLKSVPVFFEKENIDSMDPKGEFMLTLFCSFAQEESKSISDLLK